MQKNEWEELDDDGRAWLSEALGPEESPARGELVPLLVTAVELGASDLHLSANCVPHVRVKGQLRPLREASAPTAEELDGFLLGALESRQRAALLESGDLDTALVVSADGGRSFRLRASLFRQSGSLAAAFRVVPSTVPSAEALGLPPIVQAFSRLDRGLVLVTGRTGSGKSTTLATMIEEINGTRSAHIVTIEDPIEYRYHSRRALIQQREVGVDTASFATAVRHALRQDPDVILLGELRDLDTIRTALTAAETGHLVLATLHSGDTSSAIHRLIDVFPAEQQSQVRSQLALSLQGIISQELIAVGDGHLVPATEALVATSAVRNIIRDDKVHQLKSVLETSAADGMHTMDQSVAGLAGRRLANAGGTP